MPEEKLELEALEYFAASSGTPLPPKLRSQMLLAIAELKRVRALINTPKVDEFFEAVRMEAAHQVERWKSEHDEGKTDADWFWLIGYLAGKTLHANIEPNLQRHRIIAIAAVCYNWWRRKSGQDTGMRPGTLRQD